MWSSVHLFFLFSSRIACLSKKKKKSPLSTILISINGRVIFAEYLLSVHTFPS